MSLRSVIFWAHLGVGLVVGIVVAFLAITGSILSFAPQWVELAERSARPSLTSGTACAAPSVLLGNARAAAGTEPVSGLTLYTDRSRPAEVALGSRGAVLLADGCSGRILGPGANRLRTFLVNVMEVHHMMSTRGPRHQTLRAVKNAAVLGFAGLILSGLVLWWPRRLTPQHLRNALRLRGGLRGRAREWNLHTVAGFWLSLPLLVIVGTGLVMAYPWANALLFRAAGEQPPARRTPPPATGRTAQGGSGLATPGVARQLASPATAPAASSWQRLDRPFAAALSYAPWVQSVSLAKLPAPGQDVSTVQLQLGRGPGPEFIRRDQLTVSVPDGRVLRSESPQTASRGRHWRFVVRFLHTGQIFGVAGQAVALLAALTALLLVWTGFSLALRRCAAWRRRARIQPRTEATPVHATGD